MAHNDTVQMYDFAVELEVAAEKANALVQSAPAAAEYAQSGIIIDVVTKVNVLVVALKAGNWLAALRAAHDLLGLLLSQVGDSGTIQFAPGSPAAALDLKKISGVLIKLLPFLLELLAKGGSA